MYGEENKFDIFFCHFWLEKEYEILTSWIATTLPQQIPFTDCTALCNETKLKKSMK